MASFKKLPDEVRRRDILDAALTAFAEEPYARVTMARIAELAGLTKGGLYFHFSSKEQVFTAMLEDELERRASALRDAVAALDALPVAQALSQLLVRWWKEDVAPGVLTPHVLAACIEMEGARQLFVAFVQRMHEQLASLFRRWMGDGAVDPAGLAETLLALKVGMIWKAVTMPADTAQPVSDPITDTALAILQLVSRGEA